MSGEERVAYGLKKELTLELYMKNFITHSTMHILTETIQTMYSCMYAITITAKKLYLLYVYKNTNYRTIWKKNHYR